MQKFLTVSLTKTTKTSISWQGLKTVFPLNFKSDTRKSRVTEPPLFNYIPYWKTNQPKNVCLRCIFTFYFSFSCLFLNFIFLHHFFVQKMLKISSSCAFLVHNRFSISSFFRFPYIFNNNKKMSWTTNIRRRKQNAGREKVELESSKSLVLFFLSCIIVGCVWDAFGQMAIPNLIFWLFLENR